MARVYLSSMPLMQAVDKADSLLKQDIKKFAKLKRELHKFHSSLSSIRDAFADADEVQLSSEQAVSRLREAAYAADDIIDELAYEFFKVSNSSPRLFLHKNLFDASLVNKLKNFNNHLLDEVFYVAQLGFTREPSVYLDRKFDVWGMEDPVFPEIPILERKDEVSKTINLLTSSSEQQIITVVPISGMGGIGKTTLAKVVYHELSQLFDIRMWIFLSQYSHKQDIFKEMLRILKVAVEDLSDIEVVYQLEKELAGKRFLLILDDVWDNVSKWWDEFESDLSYLCENKGNAIIVTTRSEEVASMVETSNQHRLRLGEISIKECWLIMKKIVEDFHKQPLSPAFEEIGKEIASSCGGLPLAATVFGRTLCMHDSVKDWQRLRDHIATESEPIFTDVLRLSFNTLPLNVQQCFVFLSIFPKGFYIEKQELVQFWMAEGFTRSSEEGNKCFSILCDVYFLSAQTDEYGDITRCTMHDLMHALALSLSKNETLNRDTTKAIDHTSRPRHLYADNISRANSVAPGGTEKLRSIILHGVPFDGSWKLKSLRILDLKGAEIRELPSALRKLIHLRLLDVSNASIKSLPKWISKLYNLQILRFVNCHKLTKLPRKKLNNLINLKHIAFSYEHQMPFGLGKLTSLETMPLFVVGTGRGGSIRELGCLKELKGQLAISRLEEVGDENEAMEAKLEEKNLQELAFEWDVDRYFREFGGCWNDQHVLDALRPHWNIKKITINGYLGEEMPSWMLRARGHTNSDLPIYNLVDLSLLNCVNCEQLPQLGSLPHLKFLKVYGMHSIVSIDNDFYGSGIYSYSNERWEVFPALRAFYLLQMQNLSDWRSPAEVDANGVRVVAFPCLEEVSIGGCRSLTALPLRNLGSVVKLEIRNCEELSYLFDELSSFPSLTNLCIESLGKLTCVPNGLVLNTGLTELSIRNCDGLTSIPEDLGSLSLLRSLEIKGCRRLIHISDNIFSRFTTLTKLTIGHFSEELDDFSYLNEKAVMPHLTHLEIWGPAQPWIRTVSLPDQLKLLTSLVSLSIRLFSRMEALPEWLGDFPHLQSLAVINCDSLEYHSTAPVLRRLSNLRKFTISSCHLLAKSESEWIEFSRLTNITVRFVTCF